MKKKTVNMILIFIAACLLPAIVSITGNVIMSTLYMTHTAENEIEETLKATGYSLMETFSAVDSGTYHLTNGQLYKGGYNMSVDNKIIDRIKENTDIDSTLFYGDTRYLTTLIDESGERMILTQCSEEVAEIVLNQGSEYFAKNIRIGGQEYYGFYIPVTQNDKIVGMVFTGKPATDMKASTTQYFIYIMVVCLVLMIFIITVAILVGKVFTRRILAIRDVAVKLSEGHLDCEINNNNKIKELYEVAEATEALRSQLVNVVQMILNCAGSVDSSVVTVDKSLSGCTDAIKDLSSSMEEMAYSAQSMAGSVEKMAHDMDQISGNIADISDSSDDTKKVTETVTDVSKTAKENLKDLLNANTYTTQSANDVIESISSVSEAVQQITVAAKMIMDISDQTNLLSLNASIEAARAGEAGRGFAVVASEIQILAEQSNTSAQQIQAIINEITTKTEECTKIAGQIYEAVGKEAEALQDVSKSFDDVDSNISNASGAVNQIGKVVAVVDKNKISILDSISDLSGISEENAASAEETNASTEEVRANIEEVAHQAAELKAVIEQLNNSVAFFKL